MSFASDKLYNGYLRRKMPTIVTKVKVKEIMVHLPCLTTHDRENIEAKRETNGNFDGMVLLLDCLKRRENWPEQFIEALEECEQPTIAAEIRAEYDALRGVNNSNPSSPSTSVTRAHVHPAPSASHVSVPESNGAAAAPPAEAPAPPEPAAQASAPLEPPVHPQSQNSAAQQPEAVSPPEPVTEPPQPTRLEVAPSPSTPPPSPETQHTPVNTPQRGVTAHQEPEENSESDIQDISAQEAGAILNQVSTEKIEVPLKAVVTPPLSHHDGQGETDTQSHPDPPQAATSTEAQPPQSPSPTQADVIDGSSFHILTPERPPVQDTTPPADKIPALVLEPEETSEPPTTQVAERSPHTETAAPASVLDDSTLCLSKPNQLNSFQPQNHNSPTTPAHNTPVELYSGDSGRLEISDAAPDAPPACAEVTSTTVNAVFGLPCQENGIALNHEEPEENHYESPCQSLEMQEVQEVLVNVVQVSEEPSLLNLEGQILEPQAQIINGQASGTITPSPPSSSSNADAVSSLNTPSEPAPADVTPGLKTLLDSEENKASRTLPTNTKYMVTAAGVGAFALLMAWKFKN